jgi:ABC-type phosphate/phosphonate transport system ATPase subunit
MVEFLGIGVPRSDGGWLLHRVCARLEGSGLVLVLSARREERLALLDVAAGRLIPSEGRVWVDGVPSMWSTKGRIRELVGDVKLPAPLVHHRSVLWNVLTHRATRLCPMGWSLYGPRSARREAAIRVLERIGLDQRLHEPAPSGDLETAARVALARALTPGPRHLVIREPDHALGAADLERFLARVAAVAGLERLTALVSLSRPDAVNGVAGRVLALADGVLVFDGPSAAFAQLDRWPRTQGPLPLALPRA